MNISSGLPEIVPGNRVSLMAQARCCLALAPAAVEKGTFE